MNSDGILIFGGSGSPSLTKAICRLLEMEPGEGEVLRFTEGNLFVRVQENVRGRQVYLVQSTGYPANDNFMELLFWIDALKRASAESVTAVVPYLSYSRGDKKDEPRVSIRARVCADAIEAAGADRLVTVDLHAPQIQGFFRVPVDDLYALPILADAVARKQLDDLVVVSPDAGFAKKARRFASFLKAPLAIADKDRDAHDERAKILDVIGDVDGRTAVIVDDITATGSTLVAVAEQLVEKGARAVVAAVSHATLSDQLVERVAASPIERLFVTDTIEHGQRAEPSVVELVSVAPLLAEAIVRIHNRESISVLFTEEGWMRGGLFHPSRVTHQPSGSVSRPAS